MVSSINENTLIHDTTLIIRDGLRLGLTDPLGRGNTEFIRTEFPGRNSRYPVVTIGTELGASISQGIRSMSKNQDIVVNITVWSQSTRQRDEISDGILNVVQATSRTLFSGSPFYLSSPRVINAINEDEPGKGGLHKKKIEVSYIYNQYVEE